MLEINCPWCGPRCENEFSYGGEAYIRLPKNQMETTANEWADFLYTSSNRQGIFHEEWVHQAGCRQWFVVVRDTSTNQIYETHPIYVQTKVLDQASEVMTRAEDDHVGSEA